MIIHSPIISGSLTFADGATVTYPEGGVYSGSFSGSYQGDTFTGGVFTGDGSSLTFGGTGIVSSSIQITDGSNIVSSSAQISGYTTFLEKDGDSVISGSSQVEFNDVNNNPFQQGVSSVTVSKSIVPSSLTLDLGSSTSPFRDLYLSSASLYIDGQQVISSNTSELIITTDTNQSLKLVETGADTITLQSENGDITLTTTGTGNIELDAPIQVAAGNQILSSDGNAIQFGEDINVQGNITVTGTVDGVDVASLNDSVTAILSGSSADKDSFAEIVSLINSVDTTNDQAFASFYTSSNQRMGSLESFTSSIDSTIKTKLNADGIISESGQVVLQSADKTGFDGASSITTLGTVTSGDVTAILPAGTISGSSQIDYAYIALEFEQLASGTHTLVSGSSQVVLQDADKTGFTGASSITTLGTVTSGDVTAILPSGTVSSSTQITITESQISDLDHFTNTDWDNRLATKTTTDLDEGTNKYFTDARVVGALPSGTVSGSSQVVLQSADKTGFTGASSITTLGTITTGSWQGSIIASQYLDADPLPAGTISSSVQVDHDQTTNYDASEHFTQAQITTVGTVTAGSVTAILPSGTISGSSQVSIPLSQVNDVTATANEVNVLDGITASTAELNVLDGITATTAELNYVDGVTSNIQTQLDSKQAGGSYVTTTSAQALSSNADALTFAANVLTLTRGDGSTDTVNLSAYLDDTNLARIISGTYSTGSQELVFTRDDGTTFSIDASYFFDDTNLVTSVNGRTGAVTTTLGDLGVTATASELNVLDGITASTIELNYVDGVTSNIQTQLNGKLASTHDFSITLTGDVSGTGTVTNMGNVSFSTTVANDSHTHSNYITSNANDTASGIYTFSNTTASTSKTTGAVIVTGGVGIGGDLNVGGDVVAYASSDERLKDNIELISNPIEKVQSLKGVTWDWNDLASETQKNTANVGVIAQDVEKILPQLVDTRDNGFKAVDYAKLTGLLIEAIKEQQTQIDELKSKLQ